MDQLTSTTTAYSVSETDVEFAGKGEMEDSGPECSQWIRHDLAA
jgi:hypothetical protein